MTTQKVRALLFAGCALWFASPSAIASYVLVPKTIEITRIVAGRKPFREVGVHAKLQSDEKTLESLAITLDGKAVAVPEKFLRDITDPDLETVRIMWSSDGPDLILIGLEYGNDDGVVKDNGDSDKQRLAVRFIFKDYKYVERQLLK